MLIKCKYATCELNNYHIIIKDVILEFFEIDFLKLVILLFTLNLKYYKINCEYHIKEKMKLNFTCENNITMKIKTRTSWSAKKLWIYGLY